MTDFSDQPIKNINEDETPKSYIQPTPDVPITSPARAAEMQADLAAAQSTQYNPTAARVAQSNPAPAIAPIPPYYPAPVPAPVPAPTALGPALAHYPTHPSGSGAGSNYLNLPIQVILHQPNSNRLLSVISVDTSSPDILTIHVS